MSSNLRRHTFEYKQQPPQQESVLITHEKIILMRSASYLDMHI